jgi:uncharacterized protein YjbI with pentapeptide repeats
MRKAQDTRMLREDARHLLASLNDTSSTTRTGWLIFLGVMAYMVIALAGISDRDLLLNAPVQLPILGIGVVLDRFFLFAPLILLFMHAGMIVHHVMLSRKLFELNLMVSRDEQDNGTVNPLRFELDSYFYSQIHSGPSQGTIFGGILHTIVWVSLLFMPVVLLLFFQISFLPYHDVAITWAHRIYILVDLLMLLLIGGLMHTPLLSVPDAIASGFSNRPIRFVGSLAASVVAVFLSMFVATIPDRAMDRAMRSIPAWRVSIDVGGASKGSDQNRRYVFWPTAYLFESAGLGSNGRRKSFFHRNLIVTDSDLVPNRDDEFGEISLTLRNRDLRYSILDRSDLHRVDLTGSDLTGSSLFGVNLHSAKLTCPHPGDDDTDFIAGSVAEGCTILAGADLKRANLQNADLRMADLRQARFEEAQLQQAQLQQAQMQGANFSFAKLQGADMSIASMFGADMAWSNMQGADLSLADLHGANLESAELHAANLSFAKLYGANLSFSKLHGANLAFAKLQAANLHGAQLPVADMRQVSLWHTVPPDSGAIVNADLAETSDKPFSKDDRLALLEVVNNIEPDWVQDYVRGELELLINRKVSNNWASSEELQHWRDLAAGNVPSDPERYKIVVSDRLSNMACADKSDVGYLINAVAHRALSQFNGDIARVYDNLHNPRCKAGAKLQNDLALQLQKYATLHAR